MTKEEEERATELIKSGMSTEDIVEDMYVGQECEVYSRVCGYHRPVKFWNAGKQSEFKQRKMYKI